MAQHTANDEIVRYQIQIGESRTMWKEESQTAEVLCRFAVVALQSHAFPLESA